MPMYIMLSRFSPQTFTQPEDFKQITKQVCTQIKETCPNINWRESYAVSGRFDVVDLVEAPNIEEVKKAAMIIRRIGGVNTETMAATPWKRFLELL